MTLTVAIGMITHSLIIEREDRIAKEKIRKGEVDLDPQPARAGAFTRLIARTLRKEPS